MFRLIINTLSLILMIGVNYISVSGLLFSNIGDVSHKYDTLITPSNYTFYIWWLIYFLLIIFIVYNWYEYFKNKNLSVIQQIGSWFIVSNVANVLWIMTWSSEYLGLSVLIIFLLLFSLFQLVRKLTMEKWDAPLPVILFIWWPVCIYFGWIILASCINVNVYLVSLELQGGVSSQNVWSILFILLITIFNSLLIYKRNMREAAIVGIWGLIGIAYKQWGINYSVVIAAVAGALFLFSYVIYHGYKNRATSPFKKLRKLFG